jgi:hypothetical protein
MYCSSCGVAVAPGLTYCNYCGEKLSTAKRDSVIKSPEVRPETLIASMVFTFVFGLGAIAVLLGVMKAVLQLEIGPLLFFAFLCFLIMLLLEGVIIRLLFRRRPGGEAASDTGRLKAQPTRELDAAQARSLPEHMPSVTEHTTRAFDPIYPERKAK